MKEYFFEVLKAKVLTNEGASKNWRFISFLSVLSLVMIASSHSADSKTHQIIALEEDVKALKNQFVEMRSNLQQAKLKENVLRQLKERGVELKDEITEKIVVRKDKGSDE